MRKQLLGIATAAAGVMVFAISAGPAAAWHDRWYADYRNPCCVAVYGPPVVHVVPPAYAYYPRPLFYAGCCGTIYGPARTYYMAYYSHYGYHGYFAHHRRW